MRTLEQFVWLLDGMGGIQIEIGMDKEDKILEIRIDKMKNIIEPLTICYCVVIQLLRNMLIIMLCIPSSLPLY